MSKVATKASAVERQPSRVDADEPTWLKILRLAPPFLWFLLAVVAFAFLYPTAHTLLGGGAINKVSIGIIQVELANVPVRKDIDAVQRAKDELSIDPVERKKIVDEFGRLANKTRGATVLWVDDQHPYQNVRERRVLIAAGMTVDLAKSTKEAMEWLQRAKYDIVITDASRPDELENPKAECQPGSAIQNAGCALLGIVGRCYELQSDDPDCVVMRRQPGARAPKMIVYAGGYDPASGTPAFAMGMTNRSDQLFRLVLQTMNDRDI